MNPRLKLYFFVLLVLGACSSTENHFIINSDYRQQVKIDFNKARQLAVHRDQALFGVFEQSLSTEEREALMFLYAYMPLSDMADYDGSFFLKNVKLAFAARDTFAWGKTVPEDVFRHFVLPYRINNENLDTARSVFFSELLPRVKNMSMKEAALEVNHWCHEKVNYQGTDGRTIAPLGAVSTAYGRCGEESTFTATAMRAVGIPARQVYTPRWAHVDDNHAWVEVWVDGSWQFLGACEPAPDLNQGWFAAPALRTMMVHTNAFGRYQGNEQVLVSYDKYARLNLLANYAPTKKIAVCVTSSAGVVLPDVSVDFGLYNYAEFYTLYRSKTDKNGMVWFETGLGDIQVWATDGAGNFNLSRLTVAETDTLQLSLIHRIGDDVVFESDHIPPVAKMPSVGSDEGQKENDRRLAIEDSIRNGYISTFINEHDVRAKAANLNMDGDRFWSVVQRSRGNWRSVIGFFENTAQAHRELALVLAESVAEKDLHDATAAVLSDHLNGYLSNGGSLTPDAISKRYVLNPRIDLEMLVAYRHLLQSKLGNLKVTGDIGATANAVIRWLKENITLDSVNNYYGIRISPVGAFNLRRADQPNRDLFFVAACRSLGVPARLELATKVPQYFDKQWINVSFTEGKSRSFVAEKGWLSLKFDPNQHPEPLYSIHFSLAKFNGQSMETLEYEEMKPISNFEQELSLDPGFYRLLTGNRLVDGTVLVRQQFFNIIKDEHKTIEMMMRHEQSPLVALATWTDNTLQLSTTTIVGWIEPQTEPGRHFMVDMVQVKVAFEKAGYPITIFTPNVATARSLKGRLPNGATILTDEGWQMADLMGKATGLPSKASLPVFIVLTPSGAILYHTSGYQIGTAEQLLKVMQRVRREK